MAVYDIDTKYIQKVYDAMSKLNKGDDGKMTIPKLYVYAGTMVVIKVVKGMKIRHG
jgi:hypothetical protein